MSLSLSLSLSSTRRSHKLSSLYIGNKPSLNRAIKVLHFPEKKVKGRRSFTFRIRPLNMALADHQRLLILFLHLLFGIEALGRSNCFADTVVVSTPRVRRHCRTLWWSLGVFGQICCILEGQLLNFNPKILIGICSIIDMSQINEEVIEYSSTCLFERKILHLDVGRLEDGLLISNRNMRKIRRLLDYKER